MKVDLRVLRSILLNQSEDHTGFAVDVNGKNRSRSFFGGIVVLTAATLAARPISD
jgi:hypothetical protein